MCNDGAFFAAEVGYLTDLSIFIGMDRQDVTEFCAGKGFHSGFIIKSACANLTENPVGLALAESENPELSDPIIYSEHWRSDYISRCLLRKPDRWSGFPAGSSNKGKAPLLICVIHKVVRPGFPKESVPLVRPCIKPRLAEKAPNTAMRPCGRFRNVWRCFRKRYDPASGD